MRSVAIAAVLVLATACGSTAKSSCTPGAQQTCGCIGGAQGVQVCMPDGTAFGSCMGCPAADGGADGGTDAAMTGDAAVAVDFASGPQPDLATADLATSAPVIYTGAFTTGVVPSQSQCDGWNNFRAQLSLGTFSSITIKGSNDTTGVTCANAAAANEICQGLGGGSNLGVACNGLLWAIDTCGSGVEISASTGNCQCDAANGYTVRPCDGTIDWGGVKSATCDPPSQSLTVICQ